MRKTVIVLAVLASTMLSGCVGYVGYPTNGAYYQPAPVYYQPAPVYYRPAPVYYAPPPVIYRSPYRSPYYYR